MKLFSAHSVDLSGYSNLVEQYFVACRCSRGYVTVMIMTFGVNFTIIIAYDKLKVLMIFFGCLRTKFLAVDF